MMNRPNASRRLASVLIAGLLLVAARPALSQAVADPDPRWQAWIGCWAPVDMPRIVGQAAPHAVCVVPTSSAAAVEIATVDDGKVVSRDRVEADGVQHASTSDGCTGWQSAQWSSANRRVFVRSEYACAGGLTRTASGLFTMNGAGQWLDIEAVNAGGNKGVRALRYGSLAETSGLPDEIVGALRGRATAVSAARVSASASLTITDIAEASHRLDASVVEAWLVEFNAGAAMKPGALSAKHLADLVDEGVPASTIDIIVALAYPKVFALNPSTREGEFRLPEGETRAGGPARGLARIPVIGYDAYGFPIYGDQYMMDDCYSPFGYSAYSSFGCSRYCYGYSRLSSVGCGRYGYLGYGGYGYGGYGGYGWYPGGQPVVVIVRGSDELPASEPHGRVQKGRGYTQGSSDGGTSTPRSSSSSSSGSSSSGSSSGSSGSSAGTSGGSSGSSGRTAVPKKP